MSGAVRTGSGGRSRPDARWWPRRAAGAVVVALGIATVACHPSPAGRSSPRRTADLRAQWDALLACADAETCLAAAERSRYALDADLQRMALHVASFGAPAVPVLGAAVSDGSRPRRREIAELALASMGAPALEWARDHDDEVGFEVLVLLARRTSAVAEVRPLLVERLPRQSAWLLGHLRGGPTGAARNAGLAVIRLLGPDARGVVERLCPILDTQARQEWDLAMNVAEAAGRAGALACAPSLGRALTIPSFRVTTAVLEALSRLGTEDAEVRRAVLNVATSHWSPRVRWHAVTTIRFLREPSGFDEQAAIERAVAGGATLSAYFTADVTAGDPIAAAFATRRQDGPRGAEEAPACAVGRPASQPIPVVDGDTAALLRPLAEGAQQRIARQASRLPRVTLADLGIGLGVPLTEAARDAAVAGSTLLVAACAGARGGGLLAIPRAGPPRALRRGCFERLLPVGPDRATLWAFEGPRHLGAAYGRIWRVSREGDAERLVPVVDLPAEAIAIDRRRDAVLIATPAGDVAADLEGHLRPLACAPR